MEGLAHEVGIDLTKLSPPAVVWGLEAFGVQIDIVVKTLTGIYLVCMITGMVFKAWRHFKDRGQK